MKFFFIVLLLIGLGSAPASAEVTGKNFSDIQARAEKGDAVAQFDMGDALYLLDHDGIKQDLVASANWYRKAAEQGHSEAQFSLASMYSMGRGVPLDFEQAAKWYREAAKGAKKYPTSCPCGPQYELDQLFEKGKVSPENDTEAVAWYHRKANKGDVPALARLGDAYFKGQGVSQDYAEAYFWFLLASFNDHSSALKEMRDQAARPLTLDQINAARRRFEEWDPVDKIYSTKETDNGAVEVLRSGTDKTVMSFNEDLKRNAPDENGKITTCKQVIDVPVGTAHGNHSFGGICTLARPDGHNEQVRICNDVMVGHFKIERVKDDELKYIPAAIDELTTFVARNCYGG